jgi:hypothetical protein
LTIVALMCAAYSVSVSCQRADEARGETDDPKTLATAKTDGRACRDDMPVPARARRQNPTRVLRRADRPRSEGGILIKLPPHRGPVTLRFNLHNRHTYSEEEVRLKRGFASYAAGIGVLTMDNTLLSRAAVATEFRTAADLLERISGGAGPGGVKAVAPVGSEAISLELPAELSEVTILGEKLTVVRADGQSATYTAGGRPIAIVSDVTVEYVPAPAPARRSR